MFHWFRRARRRLTVWLAKWLSPWDEGTRAALRRNRVMLRAYDRAMTRFRKEDSMLGQREPMPVRYLLWGHGILCGEYARNHELKPGEWTWIPPLRGTEMLRGSIGPVRNPDSPLRLVILPGGDWEPTDEEYEAAWARGFEADKCVVRL